MDAESIVAGWKRRLGALAEDPGFAYQDTPRELIDREHARLTTFAGYAEAEVAAAEERLGVRFPGDLERRNRERRERGGDVRTIRSAGARSAADAPPPDGRR